MDLSETEYAALRRLLADDPVPAAALTRALDLYNGDNSGFTGLLHHVCHLYREDGNAGRVLSDYYAHRRCWVEALPPLYRGVAAGLEPRAYYTLFLPLIAGAVAEHGAAEARRRLFVALNEAGLLRRDELRAFDAERPEPAAFARALAEADAAAAAAPQGRGTAGGSASLTYGLLMCNYNDAAYLPRSLGAVAAQSRPFDEVLLVDDGSTDDSVAVIEDFARQMPQLRLHRLERNVGVVRAYDTGLKLISTDFVHLAAADDRLRPGFLQALSAAADAHPGLGAVFSHFRLNQKAMGVTDESSRLNRWADFGGIAGAQLPSDIFRLLQERLIWISGNSAIYRTQALLDACDDTAEHGYLADWLSGIRVMLTRGAAFVPAVHSEYMVDDSRFAFRSMNEPALNRRTTASVVRSILAVDDRPARRFVRDFFLLRPNLFEHIPGFREVFLPTTPACAGLWLDLADFHGANGRPYVEHR